ncbi:amidohydrolase 3 [Exophiala viscosa]|uniref:Amidohydrolase 3 n=1 Tax=Exophiala viscosa TaxID=2486360 RepID=A0AAN6DR11_9EURO|nr:amidohydrolase 3 [Exophiala viscosa]KAI1621073.1 amidohydrolase 3 [Exophiala viscosa]
MTTILRGGRLFTGPTDSQYEELEIQHNCMVIKDDIILHIGDESDLPVLQALQDGAEEVDLHGQLVLPGFIDSHCHISMLGLALGKLDVQHCKNIDDIRSSIKVYASANPSLKLIMCRGWMQDTTEGVTLASMLDDLDPRPILIEANDVHSTWCNTAALDAMGVQDMPDPLGGEILRDKDGKASGLMLETASFQIVWPYIASQLSREDKIENVLRAMDTYASSGYTGLIDMAMGEEDWEILQFLKSEGKLHCRIAAHWLVEPRATTEDNIAQVDRAGELNRRFNAETSPDLRIQGIKLICDGVVDSCTASLCQPYTSNGSSCDPIWTADMLGPVLQRAQSAGLQCAFHAVGDNTVKVVIDTIELFGIAGRRHRIEHMDLTRAEDTPRLGKLGITASIQPMHSDPAIFLAWPKLVGDSRCKRAFAYKEMVDGGAPLAIGTDAPTAPFSALKNLYVATTRRSTINPDSTETINKNFALPLAAALTAATKGAAYSCFAETWMGQLRPGHKADFTIIDAPLNPEALLKARVTQTWFDAEKVFELEG